MYMMIMCGDLCIIRNNTLLSKINNQQYHNTIRSPGSIRDAATRSAEKPEKKWLEVPRRGRSRLAGGNGM